MYITRYARVEGECNFIKCFNIACQFRDTLLSGKHKHYSMRPIDITNCIAIVLLKFNIYGV